MELVYHILILTFNTIIFIFSLILIIKRRKHPAISVRSPVLLFLNNFGGFLMTNIFLIYEMLEDFYVEDKILNFDKFCKIFPNNYLICHFLMIFSFILRCQRILECCKLNNDERTEVELFYKNRYKFKETFYIKILFLLMCLVTFINLILNLQIENFVLIPYHFQRCIITDNYNNAFKNKKFNFNYNDFNKNNLKSQNYESNYNNYNLDKNIHSISLDINDFNMYLNDDKNNFNLNSNDELNKIFKFEDSSYLPNINDNKNPPLFLKFLEDKRLNKFNPINIINEKQYNKETLSKLIEKPNPKLEIKLSNSKISQDSLNSYEWIFLNFIEHIIFVTYSYFLSVNPIKQLIKFELNSFVGVWIIYPNFLRFAQFYLEDDDPIAIINSHWTSYICVGFLYLCLLINGYIPIIISYLEEKKLNYHFIPKLANNLYLFLSDEICFFSFYEFILNSEMDNLGNNSINSRTPIDNNNLASYNISDKGTFFINLYTDIMKFKLSYTIEPDDNKVLALGRKVYEYFTNTESQNYRDKLEKFFEVEILNKTKTQCQILNQNHFDYEMFDDALSITYKNLYEIFLIYKRSEEFQILIDNLKLNSYIHCKMYNTGLINKF